jgi:hypothetical protein
MALIGRKSRAPRTKRSQEAWLMADDSFALRPCKVIDLSDEGARLELDEAERLPKSFRLIFSRSSRTGPRCELRWRRGRSAGVKFIAAKSGLSAGR